MLPDSGQGLALTITVTVTVTVTVLESYGHRSQGHDLLHDCSRCGAEPA
jgi:hypothetical protein